MTTIVPPSRRTQENCARGNGGDAPAGFRPLPFHFPFCAGHLHGRRHGAFEFDADHSSGKRPRQHRRKRWRRRRTNSSTLEREAASPRGTGAFRLHPRELLALSLGRRGHHHLLRLSFSSPIRNSGRASSFSNRLANEISTLEQRTGKEADVGGIRPVSAPGSSTGRPRCRKRISPTPQFRITTKAHFWPCCWIWKFARARKGKSPCWT